MSLGERLFDYDSRDPRRPLDRRKRKDIVSVADDDALPTALAFDYRLEGMNSAGIIAAGYRDAVLSWRQNDTAAARAHLDALRAAGVRIWITVEPWVRVENDAPTSWASDQELFALAEANDAWLRDAQGNITHPAEEFFGLGTTRGLDFSNAAFARARIDWVHSRWPDIAGAYYDGGFPHDGGIGWVNGYGGVSAATWATYVIGLRASYDYQRNVWPAREVLLPEYGDLPTRGMIPLNQHLVGRATGITIEGIGTVEQPHFFTKRYTWQIARETIAAGMRPFLWNLHSNLANRRAIACMTVAARGYTTWRWRDLGDTWTNKRIPELMDMRIGTPSSPTQIATDVWHVLGTRGFVVINLSAASHTYGEWTIAANDALLVQTHSVAGAALSPVVTNVGV